ncbi:MAG: hypothetical protein EXS67_04280 [Candidatus Margulisbacteria bacterium]|nr:hypothetical protein [Candidatus Margulisiibacteriota bacterium]
MHVLLCRNSVLSGQYFLAVLDYFSMLIKRILGALLFSFFFYSFSYADLPVVPKSTAEIVTEFSQMSPGQTAWIGIRLTLEKGWHTYWQNPGDNGLPVKINWTLPKGVTVDAVLWPAPTSFRTGTFLNYGYTDEVIAMARIHLSPTLTVGDSLNLGAEAKWLICQESCIPQSANLKGRIHLVLPGKEKHVELASLEKTQKQLPKALKSTGNIYEDGRYIMLSFPVEKLDTDKLREADFFPESGVSIPVTEVWHWNLKSDKLVLWSAGSQQSNRVPFKGLLKLTYRDGDISTFWISVTPTTQAIAIPGASFQHARKIALTIAFAFLGGIFLNLMPCVLPVLSLKTLSLAKQKNERPLIVRLHGIAYTMGILVSMLALSGTLILLKKSGHYIGWGFQMQSPIFVGCMAVLMLLIGLMFSDVLQMPGRNWLVKTSSKSMKPWLQSESLLGSFMTGLVATLVATPCTAPFMATAIGVALSQSPFTALVIFMSLGLGIAAPYLALSFIPATLKWIPKPGMWMVTFKKILAVPMYLSSVWLIWVLVMQLNVSVSTVTPFSSATLATLRASNQPVLVDVTAAWCLTCQVNERLVLKTPAVQNLLKEKGIAYLVADWTNQDKEITQYLQSLNRSGVPLYVYYAPGKEPVILPQILTQNNLKSALN